MPNGNTGREGWIHRKDQTIFKIAISVVIPVTAWLLLTVVGHSEELAERGSRQDRAVEDQQQAEQERNEIARKVERLDERTQSVQRTLNRQDNKLDTILERLGR